MNAGFMDGDLQKALGPYTGIKDAWKGEPCYIIGGGPSLNSMIDTVGWNFFDGKHTIGINHVIEDYDGFEWFFFLDRRFISKTTYDLKNFKGRVFARNNTGLTPSQKNTIFKTINSRPSTNIEDGLYSGNLSGLAALNLAILTGANPIYLCGFGMTGKETAQSYHYKKDYTGEDKTADRLKKFQRVNRFYSNFSHWKRRVKCVACNLPPFDTVSVQQATGKPDNRSMVKICGRDPVIAHLSFSGKTEDHADITRAIINKGHGRHSIHRFSDPLPDADLYILEHFISTRDAVARFPHKKRAINLVHSTNCLVRYSVFVNDLFNRDMAAQTCGERCQCKSHPGGD